MRIRGRKDEDSPENGRAVVKLGFLADALKREERELGVEGKRRVASVVPGIGTDARPEGGCPTGMGARRVVFSHA
ncbi:hypothetical protein Droror1_Dr00006195 [Drosera rotundifolia]